MELLHFSDYEDFACEISNAFSSLTDEFDDITVIAKYKEAKEIISELVCLGYPIQSINIRRPEWNNYVDEYLISLNFDGVWSEPMKRNGNYIEDCSSITYILDNCSSKVIPHCKSKEIYEVCIDEDCDDESDKDNTECICKDCKGNDCPSTTSTVKTEYRVNGKAVDKDTYEKELSKIEDKYLDNMRDMLFNYAEFVDEMNEWRKFLFW